MTTVPGTPPVPEQPEPGVIVNVPDDDDTKKAQKKAEQAKPDQRESEPLEAEDSEETDPDKV